MDPVKRNIYVYKKILQREDKESLLQQQARAIWLTGLSGSGKSTIAASMERALSKRNFLTQVLDGDNIRAGINNNLGFSDEDRTENIRRIAEINKLFVNCGIITINSFISPTKNIRDMARKIIGEDNFIEVYVNAPIEVCEQRDTKGLYKRARRGEIQNFTGIDAPFDPPENPDIELKTNIESIEESIEKTLRIILPEITYVREDEY
ncbi:MAG: adenylyl-sulfate kinase [Bacteroidales bacterium]|nr:adenylyl-sulfate kinase [Bacteroidales bacterium]MCF8327561.1 adenylyl-sulfate kinase [Bacteroidales bacterium]